MIDQRASGVEKFVVTGLDEATVEAIGPPPRGRGILGVLIREAKPLRLSDLGSHPHSVGFPPNHPPMRTFLGVRSSSEEWPTGTSPHGESRRQFTEEDQEVVQLLAAQAAVAIENARLYESTSRWLAQLESLTEVGNALSTEIELPKLLELIVGRLRDLIDARIVFLAMPKPDGDTVIETAAGDEADQYVGVTRAGSSKTARVLERRRSERVDSVIDDREVDQSVVRRMQARSGLWVPDPARPGHRRPGRARQERGGWRFSDEDLRIAEIFAQRAALAIDLSQRVASDALRRVVAGQELERKRLARELHDETGQALTSILLRLRSIEESTKEKPELREAVLALREIVVETLHDVRRLAVELRPKALDDFGLVPALERLAETFAEQTDVDVHLQAALGEDRLPAEIETALYRIVQEALTNVVKHAQANTVSVVLTRKGQSVVAVVEDDGRGFDPAQAREEGLGLVGMHERIALLDGRVTVESTERGGTTVAVEVPVR